MKTILFIRHAKSSWDDPTVTDFDRTLNDRGKKNAPEMAERMLKKGVKLDLLVSSPAKRAKQTARAFASVLDVEDIVYKEELYLPDPSAFTKVIQTLPSKYRHIAIFSHNPGITEYVNRLGNNRIDNMPTASIFAVKVDCENWSDFEPGKAEFWFFDYPKSNQ